MSEAHVASNKKLLGFYNASDWAMKGECYLDIIAVDLTKEEEETLRRHLDEMGIKFDVSPPGTIKGYFEGTYDRVFPIMRKLLKEGWSW